MDRATQIDVLRASLIPLRQDLEIAQGQEQHRSAAVARFTAQDQLLAKGWEQVNAAVAQLAEQSKALASGSDDGSIAKAAAELADHVKEYDQLVASAAEHYDNAINHFGIAASAAMAVSSEATRQIATHQGAPASVAFTNQQLTFTPLTFNLEKAQAQQSQALLLARQAELLNNRAAAMSDMSEVLKTAGIALPAGATDANVAEAAKATAAKASEAFNQAVQTYSNLAQSGAVTAVAKQARTAASVALILAEYSWSQFAAAVGDSATAKTHLDNALAARATAMEDPKAVIPPLPADLAPPAAGDATPAATAPSASAAWR
jgi:hypothetical protein